METPEVKVHFFTLRGEVSEASKGSPVGMIAFRFATISPGTKNAEMSMYLEQSYGKTLEYQISSFNSKDIYDDALGRKITLDRLNSKPLRIQNKIWPEEPMGIIELILKDINTRKDGWFREIARIKKEKLVQKGMARSLYSITGHCRPYGKISQRFVDAVRKYPQAKAANQVRLKAIRAKRLEKANGVPLNCHEASVEG